MAANDSTETPSLPASPHELIEQISEYLDKTDLLSLRSVFNREIVAATRRIFIKRHFWRRTHVYNFVGLQTLIDITADASLVKHIREIEVVPDPDLDYVASNPEGRWPDTAEEYMWEMSTAENRWLETEGPVMLAEVLKNLNSVSHIVSFAVSRSEESGHAYGSGLRTLPARAAQLKISHKRADRLERQNCDAVADALMEASTKEEAPIWQLDLGHHGPGCGLDEYGLRPRREVSSPPRLAWPALVNLKIHAGRGPRRWDWDDENTLGLKGLNELIVAAPALKKFALGWFPADSYRDEVYECVEPMAGIGQVMAQASLITLELGPCSLLPEKVITEFITAQALSLRSLKLSNVGLERDSSWHRVLKVLADEMSLKKIELSRIWRGEFSFNAQGQEENPCYIFTGESGSQCHIYQGDEEVVKQGLLQLVNTATEKEDGAGEGDEEEADEEDDDE
ncbi:hypothetical protein LTR10_008390 [Elasticomyces elasticus]|nr:hypothetical protein LTR10_008390 [Elasticomyces elasticus]KAK4967264.1 hypothetical protein LTR42_010613 [Elasticomyces elasticus]